MSLHDDIMRLPCTPPADANINQELSYKSGHRDARHAAAELAAESDEVRDGLLDALEMLADPKQTPSDGDPSVLREFARAAIAKARGN